MDDVAHLVVAPFSDIVDKGKTALDNAGDSEPMRKAAQSLVKEGERALKRIEPICKKHTEQFGINFRDSLQENGRWTIHALHPCCARPAFVCLKCPASTEH